MKYRCDDGQGCSLDIEAESPEKAAQEYVDGGDWGDIEETTWIDVRVVPIGTDGNLMREEEETCTVTLDPDEPDCVDGEDHDWASPHSVLGGLKDNPGVRGHGGGVIITEVCSHCGCYRVQDTWAQRPDNGQQGLWSVQYESPDRASLEWVDRINPEDC